MDEYIKKESVKKLLGDMHPKYYGDAIIAVMDLPAADVVEVVRCKDCKYRGWVQEPCHGKTVHYCKLTENRVKDNDFCSYGERRSE